MENKCMGCDEPRSLRKIKNINLWLCAFCCEERQKSLIKKRRTYQYQTVREAEEAYENHCLDPRSSSDWPAFEIFWASISARKIPLTDLAQAWGVSLSNISVWYKKCRNLLPGKISGYRRNRIRRHKIKMVAVAHQFRHDKELKALLSRAEQLRLPFLFLPKYERRFLKEHQSRMANINGHLCVLHRTSGVLKHGKTLAWRWHFRTGNIKRFDFLVLEARKPFLCRFIVPVGDLPEQFFNAEKSIVWIPVHGWQSKTRRPRFDWWLYKDNWDPLKKSKPIDSKKMAKAFLPVGREITKRSVAS
jgi:hypothetical protein